MSNTASGIRNIPPGKTWGISPSAAKKAKAGWYLVVRKTASGYEVEAGLANHNWQADFDEVDNGINEFHMVETVSCVTAGQAAEKYEAAKAALAARKTPKAALTA